MAKVSAKDASSCQNSKSKSDGHDAYCWICHNLKTTGFCSTCPRSYHLTCAGANQDGKNEWRCNCCLKLEKARSNWAKWTFDSSSLEIAFKRATVSTKGLKNLLNIVLSKDENGNKLINPIDLIKIKKRIEANEYKTPEEFNVDIKWLHHNFSIVHLKNAKHNKILAEFIASCELELTSLSHCTDCYERSERRARGWFTAYCIPPHLVIWAKYSTYPYWPGKLMSADDKMVDVQFFGDHTFETVSVDNCLIYSEQHPEKETMEFTNLYEAAQEECHRYINRLSARFGEFKYGKVGEKLNLKNMKYHLENMFPKLKDDGESIDIQFKRLIPMDNNSVMDIDDSSPNLLDSFLGTKSIIDSDDSSDSDVNIIETVESPKNPEKTIDDPTDIELAIDDILRIDESDAVDDELDPLRMDSPSDCELNEHPETDEMRPSTVNTESMGESKDESNVNLKRNMSGTLHRKQKRMRLEGTECSHVNASELSCSCESLFSQATVDFEFDKEKVTDETAVIVEQPVPIVAINDEFDKEKVTDETAATVEQPVPIVVINDEFDKEKGNGETVATAEQPVTIVAINDEFNKEKVTDETAATVEQPVPIVAVNDVVHSTQLTPPPANALTLGPIQSYIEALERLKNELWTQNMKYAEKLEILQEENRALRTENFRLMTKK